MFLPGPLGSLSHFYLLPRMLCLCPGLKAILRRKQLFVTSKWVKFGSTSSFYQLIPQWPNAWVFENNMHACACTSQNGISVWKQENEIAVWEQILLIPTLLKKKQESFLHTENGKLHFRKTECSRKTKGEQGSVGMRVCVKKRRKP